MATCTSTIQETCGRILQTVRTSNLNYSCQETPFSIYLNIRKSLSKHQQIYEVVQQPSQPDDQVQLEARVYKIVSLQSELADVEANLKATGCFIVMVKRYELIILARKLFMN